MENQNQLLTRVQKIEKIMARLKIGESVDNTAARDLDSSASD